MPQWAARSTAFTFAGIDVLRPTPAGAREVRAHASYPLVPYSNRIALDAPRLRRAAHTSSRAISVTIRTRSTASAGSGRGWSQRATTTRALSDARARARRRRGARMAVAVQRRAVALAARRSRRRGATLALKLTIANPGAAAFPFGLGWHPFFRPRLRRARSGFARAASGKPTRRACRRGMSSIRPQWRFDPARDPGVATIDNVFTGWDGEATLADADRRISSPCAPIARQAFSSCTRPTGKDFLALEPVTHMTDAFNRAARGERGDRHARAAPRRRIFLYDGDRRPPAPMNPPNL